jgi:hypothetical protein
VIESCVVVSRPAIPTLVDVNCGASREFEEVDTSSSSLSTGLAFMSSPGYQTKNNFPNPESLTKLTKLMEQSS